MWSRKFERCVECGTTAFKHRSQGLCCPYYNRQIEQQHKDVQRHRGVASTKLTKQFLIEQYCDCQKSLSDIARLCSCTRQYVFKKMREYGIPLRSQSKARGLALRQHKITAMRAGLSGQRHTVVYQKIEVNEHFFDSWSQEMAYVLGIIYTDGNLQAPRLMDPTGRDYSRAARISIAQKEPEILQKVLALMNCNAKLYFSARREYKTTVAGQLYHISIASNKLYHALTRFGLKPRKSMDIEFPVIPTEYVRHFIRGCWDGDGTVYVERKRKRLVASYVSGSLLFIKGLVAHLEEVGMPKRTIYESRRSTSTSYYFKCTGDLCIKLYHYLYDGVPPTQYLERKYIIFKKHCDPSSNQAQLF